MSVMDCLPDELVQCILDNVMNRSQPLRLDHFVQAKEKSTRNEEWGVQWPEFKGAPSSCSPPSSYTSSTTFKRFSKLVHVSQICHLNDWCAINGTCQRFRRLGKEAFFANKIFIVDDTIMEKLAANKLTQLTCEDQETAKRYIPHLILLHPTGLRAVSFMRTPRHISLFPRLRKFDYMFGYDLELGMEDPSTAFSSRRPAPLELVLAFDALGVPVQKIDLGVMISRGGKWSYYEKELRSGVYPMLRTAASIRATNSKAPGRKATET